MSEPKVTRVRVLVVDQDGNLLDSREYGPDEISDAHERRDAGKDAGDMVRDELAAANLRNQR